MRVQGVDPERMSDAQREIYDRYASGPRATPDNPFRLRTIGTWSPECLGARWLDGATRAEPGARVLRSVAFVLTRLLHATRPVEQRCNVDADQRRGPDPIFVRHERLR